MNRFKGFVFIAIVAVAGFMATACDSVTPPRAHDCYIDGHSWSGEWVVLSAPSEIEYGEETMSCKHCDAYETRLIQPTHDCDTDDHFWDAWRTTTPPTATGYGEETKTCLRCERVEMRPILPIDLFRQPSAGGNHTTIIRMDGTLWAWGSNLWGQLGDGAGGGFANDNDHATPEIQPNAVWRSVSALWGQIGGDGDGDFSAANDRSTPFEIKPGTTWAYVSAGDTHNAAIKEDGTLWVWGSNGDGKLGDGAMEFHFFDPDSPEQGGFYVFINRNTPAQLQPGTTWKSVSAGVVHTVAIRTDGTLWAWGSNWPGGQLGSGEVEFRYFAPGFPEHGGHYAPVDSYTPVHIQPGTIWRSVSAGALHTMGIREDGTLWAWGSNSSGQLGDGTTIHRNTPVHIQPGTTWRYVSAAGAHTMGIREDGTLWAWGYNEYGRLGVAAEYTATPMQVQPGTTWIDVSAGTEHTMAIQANGSLWAWGSNRYGRTGLGVTTGAASTPTQVLRGSVWKSVSTGREYTVGIRTDGSLWAWGNNRQGQLGDGTTTNRSAPVRISTVTD